MDILLHLLLTNDIGFNLVAGNIKISGAVLDLVPDWSKPPSSSHLRLLHVKGWSCAGRSEPLETYVLAPNANFKHHWDISSS